MAHIAVHPDQVRFSGTVAEAFAAAEENVEFHCIRDAGHPVGFFKIDRAYAAKYPFAPPGALGLRAFLIDAGYQGQGIGTRACRVLPAYLHTHYPGAPSLWLTVNISNPAALRAYLKGGFEDTGQTWPHGAAGPQNILHLPL